MKTLYLIILFVLFSIPAFSQNEMPVLTAKGCKIYKGEFKISSGETRHLLRQTNPDALRAYNVGKNLEIVSYIVGLSGGGLFLYELGIAVFDDEDYPSPVLLGVGIGVVGIGYLINYIAGNKVSTAVELYNASSSPNKTSYKLEFGLNNNGVGLTLKF